MADNQFQYMLMLNTDEFVEAARKAGEAFGDAMNTKPAEDLDDQIEDTTEGFGGMGSALKKLGGILIATFAVDKIKDFFVEAVKSAATVKATTAQFEQVFGDNKDVVQKTLNEMGESMGILPERLKPGLTQLTSMFKGLGVESNEATDMASKGMTLAADAAAFYDKSLEDSQASLTSFLKGNYEAGQSIGLVTNATQLAEWATKNLGKDFTKMTEAEKQNARLKFAESMMEKSGAMGQASREADGLENQMGNLKSAWDQFTAKVGNPILEKIVIPAIMGIVTVLDNLGKKMEDIDTAPFIEFGEGIKEIAQEMWETIQEGMEIVKPIFEELTPLLKPILDALSAIASVVGSVLSTAFKVLAPFVAVVVKAFGEMLKPVLELIPGLEPIAKYLIEAFGEKIQKMFPVFKAGVEFITEAFKFTLEVIKEVIKFLKKVGEAVSQFAHGDMEGAWETLKGGFSNLCEGIGKIFQTLGASLWEKFIKFLAEVLDYFSGVFANLGPLLWTSLVQIVGLLEKLRQTIRDFLIEKAKELAVFLIQKLAEYAASIAEGIASMVNSVVEEFNELKSKIKDKFNEIKSDIISKITEIKNNAINKFMELKTGIINKVTEIKTSTVNKFNEMKTSVQNKIKEMATNTVNTVKGMPSKFVSAFKSLTSSMTSIGKNAIQGLLNGLTSSWSKVTNWVTEKATWVANKFKEILKIQSPSRAFVEIGEFIDLGLVKGLENEEDRIDSKVVNIARSIPNTFAKIVDTEFKPNLNAINSSSAQTIVRNQSVPIVQLIVEGDIGTVIDKVSTKIARQTGLMIGGRV